MLLNLFIQLLAILLFSLAFFEIADDFLPGISTIIGGKTKVIDKDDYIIKILEEIESSSLPLPLPKHDSVVVVLIDAWRASFLFSDDETPLMPFLSSLIPSTISTKASICIAKSPTVTLPRLKAIMSGVAPHFTDIINNLLTINNQEKDLNDSPTNNGWIVSLAQKSLKPIALLGDETWKRILNDNLLHPNSHGTHSLMVTDTIEVDNNVTERISTFLPLFNRFPKPPSSNIPPSFSTLILHYLGLDHVGHLGGIEHPKFKPKLRELDDIVKEIYSSLPPNTLLIILGDHGMTNSGNHGGSSKNEIETAFVAIDRSFTFPIRNPKLPRATNQLDIAPTMSILFHLPINPLSSGHFNPDLIPDSLWNSFSPLQQLLILSKSALQLYNNPSKSDSLSLMITNIIENHLEIINNYKAIDDGDDEILIDKIEKLKNEYLQYLKERCKILQEPSSTSKISSYLMIFSILISFLNILNIFKKSSYHLLRLHENLFSKIELISLFNGISLLSSTFIEEEHEFWYFIIQTLLLLKGKEGIIVAILVRSVRYWTMVGYLYSSMEDSIKKFIISNGIEIPFFYFGCFVLFMKRKNILNFTVMFVVIAMKFLSYRDVFDADFDRIDLERGTLIYLLLAQLIRFIFGDRKDKTIFIYLFILLKQTYNCLPLVMIYYSTLLLKGKSSLSDYHVNYDGELYSLFILSYFIMGNSHLISSIDLTSSYFGIRNFNLFITGTLAFISTWAGPLLISIIGFNYSNSDGKKKLRNQLLHGRYLIQLFLMISIFLQRNHLSLWTVWAPRLLFEWGWILCYMASLLIMQIN